MNFYPRNKLLKSEIHAPAIHLELYGYHACSHNSN